MVSLNSQPVPDLSVMRPPPLPSALPRRPTIGSKRDSSFVDTDDETGLSASTKKLKVAFDPHIDVRILDDTWGNKSMDLVREEVKLAIERARCLQITDDEIYFRVIRLLRQDPFGGEAACSKLLVKYVVALEARASSLDSFCYDLVTSVLDLSWLGRDETFVAIYTKFLVSIATTHLHYVTPMMDRMLAVLRFLPSSLGRLPQEDPVPRSVMFSRLHEAVKAVLDKVPAASNILLRSMRVNYPNELATIRSYTQYQKHILRLADCAPEIKPEVIALIVQRLVALDVQVQHDVEDLGEDAEEDVLQRHGVKTEEVDDSDESDVESVSSSEETRTEDEERFREVRLKVAKMDATMDLLFSYYTSLVLPGDDVRSDEAHRQLMAHFATFILPSRTRHAQFLLFHFSQASDLHITEFSQLCIEAGFGTGSMAQKCSAIAYLSSFVARGSHVPRGTVQQCVHILCVYLESMRKQSETNCRGPDRRAYMEYYAVAQALLYIFCFRWRDLVLMPKPREASDTLQATELDAAELTEDPDDLLADQGELNWFGNVKQTLQTNIFCILNPLRVCAPAIVTEFANISRHVRFIEVISKIESNKRLRLGQAFSYYGSAGGVDIGRRETAWDRKKGDAHHQLEPYFPFDPYQLPTSKRWLHGDYNEWRLPRGMRQDDDEDDYEEDASDADSDEGSLADLPDGDDAGAEIASDTD